MWFFERPIRVQSLGYVVLTHAAVCVSELSILLTEVLTYQLVFSLGAVVFQSGEGDCAP